MQGPQNLIPPLLDSRLSHTFTPQQPILYLIHTFLSCPQSVLNHKLSAEYLRHVGREQERKKRELSEKEKKALVGACL